MTETTAKSGGSGPSATPVGETPGKNGAEAAGRSAPSGDGRPTSSGDGQSPAQKFTRAPGMAPPPGDRVGGEMD